MDAKFLRNQRFAKKHQLSAEKQKAKAILRKKIVVKTAQTKGNPLSKK